MADTYDKDKKDVFYCNMKPFWQITFPIIMFISIVIALIMSIVFPVWMYRLAKIIPKIKAVPK